jgi:thiol:disulfide interchange protein
MRLAAYSCRRRTDARMLRLLLIAALLWGANIATANQAALPGAARDAGMLGGSARAFLRVDEAYPLQVELRDGQVRVQWDIAPGYYLYRERIGFGWNTGDFAGAIAVTLPAGEAHEDAYLGATEVYRGMLAVTLPLPGSEPVLLEVKSQGCADAGLCYPPRTRVFAIDPATGSVDETEAQQFPVAAAQNAAPPPAAVPADLARLLWMALLAALGGMILNLMPCVFPVLSLKVLGIAAKGGNGQGKALHGLAYAAGVVLSFVAVAGLLLALRGAGAAIGWGFHLQSPAFVAALAYLFVVMGLALSGMINLGSGVMGSGESLARQGGYRGTFFTGVLATVVASPCSAPFMGTALGFAMTQPPVYALAIFAALGLGMAAPFVLLTLSPALLRRLPHPGPWMDGFKQFLAFPLYAAAVWLLWVLGNQTGVNGMAAVTGGCVLLALGLWCWEHAKLHRRPLPLRLLGVLICVLALLVLRSPLLDERPVARTDSTGAWEDYSPARLEELRAAGTPVFVNVTADWCITCLANERIALSSEEVLAAFRDRGIVYLKGDWTNSDPELTALLQAHGRSGVPLYLLYPATAGAPATLLPQLLTPSIVLEFINSR